MRADQIRRFATLGNHLPRHCGIATFTTHLTDALVEQLPGADGFVIAMNDGGRRHAYPSRVRFEIGAGDLSSIDVRLITSTSTRSTYCQSSTSTGSSAVKRVLPSECHAHQARRGQRRRLRAGGSVGRAGTFSLPTIRHAVAQRNQYITPPIAAAACCGCSITSPAFTSRGTPNL
jgi:hypothetical protein